MVDKNELLQQLRKLKKQIQEDPQVRALYDLDGDGKISGEEWEKARQAVIRFMEIKGKKAAKEPAGSGDSAPGKAMNAAGAAGVAIAGAAGAADYVFQKLRGKAARGSDAGGGQGQSYTSGTLLELSEIVVQQQVEGLELVTDFEGRNRYKFFSVDGRQLGSAEESDTGFAGAVLRSFFTTSRAFTMGISVLNTPDVIWLKRRFDFIFSRIDVTDDSDLPVGNIQQRFGLINRKYDLVPADGSPILNIRGPLFKPWTFFISDQGRQVGIITKKWSGLLKEAFTRADSFTISIEDPKTTPSQRKLILGAAIAIDIDYFEQKQQ